MSISLGMPATPPPVLAPRRKTRKLTLRHHAHPLEVGGDAPISVQSMATTLTADINATLQQIAELTAAGCQVVRVAVPSQDDCDALPIIAKKSGIPVIADIHFQPKYVFAAIDAGCAAVRVNPGNIKQFDDKVKEIAKAAKEAACPIRIGVNGGECPRNQKDQRSPREGAFRMDLPIGTLREDDVAAPHPHQRISQQAVDADHEAVHRDGEGAARLADTAKVHGGDEEHDRNRHCHVVPVDERECGAEIVDRRGDGHGHGHDVVDHQGGRDEDAGALPEIGGHYLVVATTRWVGVHVLPVRRHHHEEDEHDECGGQRGPLQEGDAAEAEHQQDFLRRVGVRGERVGCEDRERQPLREQRLGELITLHRSAEQDALQPVPYLHLTIVGAVAR